MVKSLTRAVFAGSLVAAGLATLPALSARAAGADVYVAEGGSDTGTCSSAASPCATVTYAIAQSGSPATVHVSGRVHDNIEVTGDVVITGESAASRAILDGSATGTVLYNTGTVDLRSLTVTNGGSTTHGGGLSNSGEMTLTDVTVTGNTADDDGGGVRNYFGTLTAVRTTITGNAADSGGGVAASGEGSVTLVESTVSGNHASGGVSDLGGGILGGAFAEVHLLRSTVSGNSATQAGGIGATTATIVDSTVTANDADYGAGVYLLGGDATATIVGSTIARNTRGGGLWLNADGGTATIGASILAKNTSGNCTTTGAIDSLGYNLTNDNGVVCGLTAGTDRVGTTFGLGPLQNNGGPTQTIVPTGAGASRVVPQGTVLGGVAACHGQDQRLRVRPQPTFTACTSGAVEPGSTAAAAPKLGGASSLTVDVGASFDVPVTSTGRPTPTLGASGLPSGVSFTDNGDGTGDLFGSTSVAGTHLITLTASNGVDPDAVKTFTLRATALPTISVNDVSVTEGNSGTKTATFTLSRAGAVTAESSVTVATTDGTATAGSDYVAVPPTVVSFAAGARTATVRVTVKGDTTIETDETFTLGLSSPVHATISDASATGTITSDDAATTLAVDDVRVVEGDSGTSTATFTITRAGSTALSTTVRVSTADGTASAGSDYVAVPLTTVTFAAGQTTRTLAVTIDADTVPEPDETFVLTLSAPVRATITDDSGTGTIINDDLASISVDDVVVAEGRGDTQLATFTLTRSGATGGTASVKVATASGTATAGSDFRALPLTTVGFAAGQSSRAISVSLKGDTVVEADETFRLNLSAPVGATIGDPKGTGTILNDDATSIGVDDVTVSEDDSGAKAATFTLTRHGDTSGTSTVDVVTDDLTATAGSDYTALPRTTVGFAAGEVTESVSVTVKGDTTDESNETFHLVLTDPVGASVDDQEGIATIVDDEGAPQAGPTTYVTVDDVAVGEGDAGTTSAVLTLRRYGDVSGTSTVHLDSADAGATSADYTPVSTTVSFAAGQTTRTVTIAVTRDTLPESTEAILAMLSAPTGAAISKPFGSVTILDDDVAFVGVQDATVVEGDSGTTTVTFTVTRRDGIGSTSSVTVGTSSGTATTGVDFVAKTATVTFAAGQATKTVTVGVTGDVAREADETFELDITGSSGATVADASATATIIDDD